MKKGISLIVLVITIIVIIILSGAVILSLSNNNPITQSTLAKKSSDKNTVQSAVTLFLAKVMADCKGAVVLTPGGSNALIGSTMTVNGLTVYKNTAAGTAGTAFGAFASAAAAQAAAPAGLGAAATAVTLAAVDLGITLPTDQVWTVNANGTVTGT